MSKACAIVTNSAVNASAPKNVRSANLKTIIDANGAKAPMAIDAKSATKDAAMTTSAVNIVFSIWFLSLFLFRRRLVCGDTINNA